MHAYSCFLALSLTHERMNTITLIHIHNTNNAGTRAGLGFDGFNYCIFIQQHRYSIPHFWWDPRHNPSSVYQYCCCRWKQVSRLQFLFSSYPFSRSLAHSLTLSRSLVCACARTFRFSCTPTLTYMNSYVHTCVHYVRIHIYVRQNMMSYLCIYDLIRSYWDPVCVLFWHIQVHTIEFAVDVYMHALNHWY